MKDASVEITSRATNDWFGRFAASSSGWLGSKWAFAGAGLVIVTWAVTGPFFHFSDTWQLMINTGTTIVTFLMVFLIQNTQNRDARTINLKLNEPIRAIDKARDQMIVELLTSIRKLSDTQRIGHSPSQVDIENLSDLELDEFQVRYEKIRAACDGRQKKDAAAQKK
jgi:low affinity Fe/Cu permease